MHAKPRRAGTTREEAMRSPCQVRASAPLRSRDVQGALPKTGLGHCRQPRSRLEGGADKCRGATRLGNSSDSARRRTGRGCAEGARHVAVAPGGAVAREPQCQRAEGGAQRRVRRRLGQLVRVRAHAPPLPRPAALPRDHSPRCCRQHDSRRLHANKTWRNMPRKHCRQAELLCTTTYAESRPRMQHGGTRLLYLPHTQLGSRVILSLGHRPCRLRCSVLGPPSVRRAGRRIRAGFSASGCGAARPRGLALPGATRGPFQQVRWHAGSARVCCRGQWRPHVPQQRACQRRATRRRRGGRPGPAGAPGSGRLRAARCWQTRRQQAARACPGGAGCLCAVLLLQHSTLWPGFIRDTAEWS